LKTLFFLTSGFGDNLLALPLALELAEKTSLTVVAPAGPQADFFARCLPGVPVIRHNKSSGSFAKILWAGLSSDWVYPIGACTRGLRLLHLAAIHRRAIGFTSLNSSKAWQAEIGLQTALMPDLAKRAWKNNLRLLRPLGLDARRGWDDYVKILRPRLTVETPAPSRLVIHPGSAKYAGGIEKYKRWPVDRFAAVADRLLASGRFKSAAWILGPDDEDLEGGVKSAIGKAARGSEMEIVSYRKFGGSLIDLGGWLGASGHMLTNDSGLAHLASLYGTPLTALSSGLGQPSYTGQNGSASAVIMEPTECYGCAVGISTADAEKFTCEHDWACMDRITIEKVATAIASTN
jgi:ADP-heptose:LPS heptosyltransferase